MGPVRPCGNLPPAMGEKVYHWTLGWAKMQLALFHVLEVLHILTKCIITKLDKSILKFICPNYTAENSP